MKVHRQRTGFQNYRPMVFSLVQFVQLAVLFNNHLSLHSAENMPSARLFLIAHLTSAGKSGIMDLREGAFAPSLPLKALLAFGGCLAWFLLLNGDNNFYAFHGFVIFYRFCDFLQGFYYVFRTFHVLTPFLYILYHTATSMSRGFAKIILIFFKKIPPEVPGGFVFMVLSPRATQGKLSDILQVSIIHSRQQSAFRFQFGSRCHVPL